MTHGSHLSASTLPYLLIGLSSRRPPLRSAPLQSVASPTFHCLPSAFYRLDPAVWRGVTARTKPHTARLGGAAAQEVEKSRAGRADWPPALVYVGPPAPIAEEGAEEADARLPAVLARRRRELVLRPRVEGARPPATDPRGGWHIPRQAGGAPPGGGIPSSDGRRAGSSRGTLGKLPNDRVGAPLSARGRRGRRGESRG
jgi:hypothetical protein